MERRHLLATGAALAAASATALPGSPATAAARTPPPALPPRTELLASLHRAADHWIAAHRDPGDNQWARATFFSGLLTLYRTTGAARHLNYARSWAEAHDYGLHNGVATRHADDHTAGQAYLDLHELDGARDELQTAALEESLHRMAFTDRPDKSDDWWWDDALHMALPPFLRLGLLRGERRYLEKAHRLYTHTKSAEGGAGLYETDSGLWYRDARFLPGGVASPSGKRVLWSRGNGWVAGGYVKALQALPPAAPHTDEYRSTLVQLLTAARKVQRPDGFWNVNLADPAHLPGPETSGTAFLTYGVAHAVRTGLLPRREWLPVAARAWHGMTTTALHRDGLLGYVQGVGDRPESSQPVTRDSTADFGVGGFLLAGTELAKLAR